MRTPQQLVERYWRTRQQARELRKRIETNGWIRAGMTIFSLELAALDAEQRALAWVLEVDEAAMSVPDVRGAKSPTTVCIQRHHIPPKPPMFPASMTIYLLEVPADTSDDWQTGRWSAMLSPTQYHQLVAAMQGVPSEAYVAAVSDDEPEGA